MSRKKKTTIISGIVIAATVALGIVYFQFFMITHQLPEPGEKFVISNNVKKVIRENVDNGKHESIFIGIVDGNSTDYYHYGTTAAPENDGRPIDENTIFEIGSVTKVITSIILADMVQREEVSLDDPIDRFLPEDLVDLPSKYDDRITLFDLATHTSGFPREADNFPVWDFDAYPDYDEDKIYEYLSDLDLPRDAGSQYEYSNFGASLLGHVLSLNAGKSYEQLLDERISKRLGMNSTCIEQCQELQDRFAKPHFFGILMDEYYLSDSMAGAGAIRSSGSDMLLFLQHVMGHKDSDLTDSFELTQVKHHYVSDELSIGLGWHISYDDKSDKTIVWHNGGTGGFKSFVGFNSENDQGVVILTNSKVNVDDIAVWMFRHGHTS